MKQAKPTKFYFAKYFFLALCAMQWIVGGVVLLRFGNTGKNQFASLIFFTLGLLFLAVFIFITDRIKRVAVGKNKIVVFEGSHNSRFEWPDVKSLNVVPFFNLYKLRIKGKKRSIYFFPSRNIASAFGLMTRDTSKMGEIVEKRKKQFGFK
jgi:hypothetical protein